MKKSFMFRKKYVIDEGCLFDYLLLTRVVYSIIDTYYYFVIPMYE